MIMKNNIDKTKNHRYELNDANKVVVEVEKNLFHQSNCHPFN